MLYIFIGAIAAAILIYSSFFTKSEPDGQTELLAETVEDSAVDASVIDKQIAESGIKRNHYLVYTIKFECMDGITRELSVTPKLFDEIQIGERETLVYKDSMFIGFGNHGAVEADADSPEPDGFTYDDFDESIDIEQELDESGKLSYDDETRELFSKFTGREKLPAKSEIIEDETGSLRSYSADEILSGMTLYPFLQQESEIRRLLARTYNEAMQDLLGFDGNSRKGMAADSVYINKNEIRVVITLQEAPAPLKSHVTVELGVNE